jgi:hypothetical protein
MEDIKTTLRKLKPFIGKKADHLWMRYSTGDRLEKQEWTEVINLLAGRFRINTIEETVTLPQPNAEQSRGVIPKIGRAHV